MRFEQRLPLWQTVRPCLQPLPAKLHRAQDRPLLARLEIRQRRSQFRAHRHCHFGCRGGRRRAAVRRIIGQSGVGFMPHRADRGDRAIGDGAHHHFLVEAPQILDRTASPRHDDEVGPIGMALWQGGKPAHRACHLLCRALALHQHRPHDHAARETVCQPVEDIADHRPRGRGNHPDGSRQIGQWPFARRIEQPFRFEPCLGLFQQRQQRPFAGQLHPFDHDLVFRAPRIGRDLARRHDFQPVFRAERQAPRIAAPHHPVEHGVLVLERAVHMPACGPLHARQFAAQPHEAEPVFHRSLERLRYFAHRQRLGVVACVGLRYQARII